MSMAARKQSFEERAQVTRLAVTPRTPLPASLLLNRELSLLEFHRRVLEEARDEGNLLLERLKFLSIFASNIDEFFMVRVSGLKEEVEQEIEELSPDGMTPAEQLAEIRRRLLPLINGQMRCLNEEILPQLKEAGLELATYESLLRHEKKALND